jgi:hypothetical protein
MLIDGIVLREKLKEIPEMQFPKETQQVLRKVAGKR